MCKEYKICILLLFTTVLFVAFTLHTRNQTVLKPPSRIGMEMAMQMIRNEWVPASQAGIFYARVAKTYYDNLDRDGSLSDEDLRKILAEVIVSDRDSFKLPRGDGYWISTRNPVSPHLGDSARFILDDRFAYTVPTPPVYGSEEYKKSIAVVKEASDNRTLEQTQLINYWAGVTGTETPAGIWQNKLWEIAQKYNLTDREYAYVQMVLAEGMADAFMECWKVKYLYWTKRPDMADSSIRTAIPNPNFPSYVSGHATISYAAGTILAHLFPNDAEAILKDAETAKNTRLWAGIHFAHDNDEGEKLGVAIAEFIIQKLHIQPIRES